MWNVPLWLQQGNWSVYALRERLHGNAFPLLPRSNFSIPLIFSWILTDSNSIFQITMVVLSQVTHASHLKNKNDISKSNLARDSSVVVFLVHSFDSKFNVGCWFPGGGGGEGFEIRVRKPSELRHKPTINSTHDWRITAINGSWVLSPLALFLLLWCYYGIIL